MKKFSKSFGEVEVITEDKNFTTIVILATGEQKKLSTQYANLSNEPFVEVKKVVKKQVKRELTQEEKQRAEAYTNAEMKEAFKIGSMGVDQRREYKANKSKRIHL